MSADARFSTVIGEAESLAGRGLLTEAIATLQRAISTAEDPALHVALSTLYLRRGDVPAADRALDRAMEVAPDYGIAYAYKGGMLLQLGRASQAQEFLDRALVLSPNELLVRVKRAEFWIRLGVLHEARVELRTALSHGGGDARARDVAHTMLADVERRLRGSAQRAIVPLPQLSPLRRLLTRNRSQLETEK